MTKFMWTAVNTGIATIRILTAAILTLEKDGNRGKFIGPNLVILSYEEFGKFALCKSVSQSEATFIVYSQPIDKTLLPFTKHLNTKVV